MSYTEQQLWALLDQTYSMPYGPGQIALVEQVVTHADALRLTDLAFAARMQATQAYVYGGERARSFATFAWCLAGFDRDPQAHHGFQRTLLWHFKYMVSALTRFPEVPLERTYGVLDDMERRWRETGHSMHAVHAYRHEVAAHIGDVEAAEAYYRQWCAAPRDDLSDCVGCDPTSKAWWLANQGRDEEAVALGDVILSGQLTCSEQPQSMLITLMVPYLKTGRLDEARPAGAGVELRLGAKQLRAAAGTPIDAGHLGVRVRARERPLRRLPSQDGVLLGREALAPLLVGQLEPSRHHATTSETATNCVTAAATTSRWKTSWKPMTRGNGFGHLVA